MLRMFYFVLITLLPLVSYSQAQQYNCTDVLKHLDFDEEGDDFVSNFNTSRPIVFHTNRGDGSFSKMIREHNDCTSTNEATNYGIEGGGILSRTSLEAYGSHYHAELNTSWGGNRFLRFYSLKSSTIKDRAEISLYGAPGAGGLYDGREYSLSYDFKLPPENYHDYYIFPRQEDWFIITQIKKLNAGDLVPILSVNLLTTPDGTKKIVVSAKKYDYYHREGHDYVVDGAQKFKEDNPVRWVQGMPEFELSATDAFTPYVFNTWMNIELKFKLSADDGYAELNVQTTTSTFSQRKENLNIGHPIPGIPNSEWGSWVKMGLYRGSSSTVSTPRDGFIVDFDNIVLQELNP